VSESAYPPMRNNVVPQTGHTPFMAFLPFFMVTLWGLCISRFVLHFTQYAVVVITNCLVLASRAYAIKPTTLEQEQCRLA
jgi:hypothetical protein